MRYIYGSFVLSTLHIGVESVVLIMRLKESRFSWPMAPFLNSIV